MYTWSNEGHVCNYIHIILKYICICKALQTLLTVQENQNLLQLKILKVAIREKIVPVTIIAS